MTTANLNYVELPATDLVATKAFYEEVFGWAFTDYGPGYAAAQVSGIEVALNAEATVGAAQADGDQNPTGPLLLLQTADLQSIHSALDGRGSAIVTPPFEYPGGNRLHFRDPSGNVLGAYQPQST